MYSAVNSYSPRIFKGHFYPFGHKISNKHAQFLENCLYTPKPCNITMNNQIKGGKVEFETVDNARMTRYQRNIVVSIIKGHVEDKNYWFEWAKVHVNRYFVSVSLYYYPVTAIHNPYLTESKNFWIGKKGGIRRATTRSGIGKEFNVKNIAHHYFKASD